ncbi:MAG: hypothetical protein GKR87_01705 [Kiritimatiellae bacterium]|nr:hypothetical protein [Kiritimatiellia bacterium]
MFLSVFSILYFTCFFFLVSYGATTNTVGPLVVRLTVGSPDADGDGMPDDWETSFFGDTSRDGTGDLDGDGMIDVDEFLAGTIPTDPNSVLRIEFIGVQTNMVTLMWQSSTNTDPKARRYNVVNLEGLLSTNQTIDMSGIDSQGLNTMVSVPEQTNTTERFYYIKLDPFPN